MRIDQIHGKIIETYAKTNKIEHTAKNPYWAGNDSFEISSDARMLSSAMQQAKTDITKANVTLRMELVNQVREHIKSGQYQVKSNTIAAAMLNMEQEDS